MLAALIAEANSNPTPPPVDPYTYLRSGGVSEEEEAEYYKGYFEPQVDETNVAWELSFDEFKQGKVDFSTFALRAARIGNEVRKVDDMKLAIEVIEKRREMEARMKLLRTGAIIGVSTWALWRILVFL